MEDDYKAHPMLVPMEWIYSVSPRNYDYYRDEYVRTGDETSFSKMLDKVRI
jgi:hypothetical protein